MAWVYWTDEGRTAYLLMSIPTIYATGATTTITIPNPQFAVAGTTETSNLIGLGMSFTYGQGWSSYGTGLTLYNNSGTAISYLRGNSGYTYVQNGTYANAIWSSGSSVSITTSTYFNSSNSTTRTIQFPLRAPQGASMTTYASNQSGSNITNPSVQLVGNISITLDAPPTFTTSSISYDTPYVYSGLTTASVTTSNSSAKYGGSITSVAFTVGSQTVTSSNDGTLSILLNQPGTFTPTVTVTDSRGQTATETLDPITVNTYTAPSVSFDIDRTTSAGVPDDEGTYGLIEATLTFSDVVATAQAPSVVLTDDGGTQTTPTVTWYTSSALSTQVTWANVSSGDTVYGLFSGLSTQHSYQVSVRPRDNKGTGTAITQTVGAAFYTIDFYAGGHGIAFGQPATTTGFECNMTAIFKDDATFDDDVLIGLPNYTTSGTTDYDIYTAVVALGWDSDVLVN